MSDTRTQRHMAILRYLPEEPKYTTTKKLKELLQNDGFEITMRMLQRDIDTLCCQYAISCDDSVRPYRWFRIKGASDISLEMTPSTALAVKMLEERSQYLLPKQVNDNLAGFFSQATRKLTSSPENPIYNWPSKIETIPLGFQLERPTICKDVIHTVELALMHQKVLHIDYRPRPPRYSKNYDINPLGLVERGGVYYLVATLLGSNDFRHFTLHRMTSAELGDTSTSFPEGFDLSVYIKAGHMSFSRNKVISLELKVSYIEGYHLLETPLSKSQKITYPDSNHFIIHADVNDTEELKWWLMSISDISEVLSPQSLRDRLASSLITAVKQYS
ncbi:helix-turn-helix transcriptional regulator [Vibrio splendidus]